MTRPHKFDGSAFLPPGVRHEVGLADELLQELAPLLAAEGVDLENPPENLEVFNAALHAASERRNMELFIPVGEERGRALEQVFTAVKLLAMGRPETTVAAYSVLDTAVPKATETLPSVGHICGVAWGLLDQVMANGAAAAALDGFTLPNGPEPVRLAAAHTLIEAREGRASASNGPLVGWHNGLNAMKGAVAALAGVLVTAAQRLDTTVAEVVEGELGRGEAGGLTAALARLEETGGSAPLGLGQRTHKSRKKTRRSPASDARLVNDRLRNNATAWYTRHEAEDALDTETFMVGLRSALTIALGVGLDPHSPEDVCTLAEFILMLDPGDEDEEAEVFHLIIVGSLSKYVAYQLSLNEDSAAWQEAMRHCAAASARAAADTTAPYRHESWPEPVGDLCEEVVRMRDAETAAERQARLEAEAGLPAMQGIPALLEWIGKGRPVTATGSVRRADLAAVGGFLRLDVVGVASPRHSKDGPRQIAGMWDHRLLSNWWMTLQRFAVLDVGATKVWAATTTHVLTEDGFVETVSRDLVANAVLPAGRRPEAWQGRVAWLVINLLSEAIQSGGTAALPAGLDMQTEISARQALSDLRDLRLLDLDTSDGAVHVSIPPQLRLLVGDGAAIAKDSLDASHHLG